MTFGNLEKLLGKFGSMFANFYRDKVVLVTGHTGFKGSWLCEWLLELGAKVHGFSNAIDQNPSLFETLDLGGRVGHIPGDVRNFSELFQRIRSVRPDVIFHLAAQPLVRRSYKDPLETIQTNVLGTVHLLESIRTVDWPLTTLVVTSDKCYENREIQYGYREIDALGGFDPYSASKGAAELLFHSYRRSFFSGKHPWVRLASARAGNVIGGGDWSEDRLVPDAVRSLSDDKAIPVRNPRATRPWQHVLEPLSGYLNLAWRLATNDKLDGGDIQSQSHSSFNFGPQLEGNKSVRELILEILKTWPGTWEDLSNPNSPHEASFLNLTIDKANHILEWKPVLSFFEAVRLTMEWYRGFYKGLNSKELTANQIRIYFNDAKNQKINWAISKG